MARPFTFPVFKVSKSSLEFVRFEAEIENYSSMENVLAKLDMRTIKLSGFTELLKLRAAESKTPFPTRADWDEFFRDNVDMNEMKAGERPDTIHLENLPVKWYLQMQNKTGEVPDKPSEFVLKKAFSTFGDIRIVDIPMLDPYRQKMTSEVSGIRTFSFGEDLIFQAYIQFKEYIGFVKCMNALKGMKLCYKDRDSTKAWTANIKVDFDKSKHLAESTIKKRKAEREKLIKEEVDKMEEEKKKTRLEELKKNEQLRVLEAEEKETVENRAAKKLVAEQRRIAREERRKKIRLKKMGLTEEEEMAYRIGAEERKLVMAQRKLESIRILDELISRAKGVGKINTGLKAKLELKEKEKTKEKEKEKEAEKESDESESEESDKASESDEELKTKEKEYRDKLVMKLKKKDDSKNNEKLAKIKKSKNDDFESVSDTESESATKRRKKLRLEKISDKELSDVESVSASEIDSEEEDLRLTSTDEDSEYEDRKSKKKKKEKREKSREKDRRKKDDKRRNRDSDRKRELEREIRKAERIAKRSSPEREDRRADLWEHEKYDRERDKYGDRDRRDRRRDDDRERTPTGYYGIRDYFERRRHSPGEDEYIDDREKDKRERKKFVDASKMRRVNQFLRQQGMRKEEVEKEMERAYTQYFSSLAKKEGPRQLPVIPSGRSAELSKEEEWERMMNPHLYGDDKRTNYRKANLAQHYEEDQREQLQAEIRIRERREREGHGRDRSRSRDRRRGRSRSRDRRRDRY